MTEPRKDVIYWHDEPHRNARVYVHPGCDEGPNGHKWIVPLDDCPAPKEATDECAGCCHVLPLLPRGAIFDRVELVAISAAAINLDSDEPSIEVLTIQRQPSDAIKAYEIGVVAGATLKLLLTDALIEIQDARAARLARKAAR